MAKKDDVIKEFTSLKGVGKKKAELLYDNGLNSMDKLKKASIKDLTAVEGVNEKLAKELSYIDIEKKSDKITVDNIDQWSALNEITEKLTHGDIAKNMAVVLRKYSQLDNIFTPQIQVK